MLNCEGDLINYAGLDRESRLIASALVAQGVVKGARVALMMDNGIDWACAAVAIMRIGAVLVPLSTRLQSKEMKRHLRRAAVTHLIGVDHGAFRGYEAELVKAPRLSAELRVMDDETPSLLRVWQWQRLRQLAAPDSRCEELVEPLGNRVAAADDMAIVFTYEPAGDLKAVIHTHGNAIRSVCANLEVRRVRRGEAFRVPLPLHWVGGLGGGLLSALAVGATLVTEELPEIRNSLRFLYEDCSSRGYRVLAGMTETFGPYCGALADENAPRGSIACGPPLTGIELRVADLGSGPQWGAFATGTIKIRGSNMMRGICGKRREELFDRDGFYATGDLGYLDDDGHLHLVGRRDEVFQANGTTIWPNEIEDALEAGGDVERAFVTSISEDIGGEREIGAAVVATSGRELQLEELAIAVKRRLTSSKVPTRWLVTNSIDQLPHLPDGKLDKVALQGLIRRANVRSRDGQTTRVNDNDRQ